MGTSANEAASARKHYAPCQRAPLSIYIMLKQAVLCKLSSEPRGNRIKLYTLMVPLVWWRKPDTVLLCLRPALPDMGGPDSISGGYSQLVPMAGQGTAVLQLLAPGSEGISCFPLTSATWSASPFPINRTTCLQ